MTPAERAVEDLMAGRKMRRRNAEQVIRNVRATELRDAAGRFDRAHVSLIRTPQVVAQLNQDADAIDWGDPLGGAA